jgi:hypothetical protein
MPLDEALERIPVTFPRPMDQGMGRVERTGRVVGHGRCGFSVQRFYPRVRAQRHVSGVAATEPVATLLAS